MLQIGPYALPNPVALAPMAGVTDLPFRRLCAEQGAGLVVSEMVTADPTLRESRKTLLRSRHDGEAEPRSVQIVGNDPATMAEAARYNVGQGAQIIDINMGCPAKKVCKKAAGSALLADEALVARILDAVVTAVDVPVTLKIRTGSTPEARNGVAIARIAEQAGIQALAVHGRTRADKFNGTAEYDTIAAIVAATSFPVFANGDITSPEQAARVRDYTGAAGIMIGRGAQGQAWLCGQIAHYLTRGEHKPAPSLSARFDIMRGHLRALHDFYGDFMGVRIARKHTGWYLQHLPVSGDWRKRFNALGEADDQLNMINHIQTTLLHEDIAA